MARHNKIAEATPQTPGVHPANTRCLQGGGATCYRYRLEDVALLASVKEFGILRPLIVSTGECPVVISGHKRLHAAKVLNMKAVPVLVAEKLAPEDAFFLNLVSNWKQGCSEVDRAKALGKATRELKFKENDILRIVMPLLGLPADDSVLELYLKVDQFPESLKDLMEDGGLPLRSVTGFLKFSYNDQEFFAKKIGGSMKLTSSQLQQTGEWLADILKGTGKNLNALCKEHQLLKESGARGMDPRTKADKFFARVKRLRFPEYSRYMDEFEERQAAILCDANGIRLEPVQGFEEPGFELHARVKTPEEFDRLLKKLSGKRTALNSLFEIAL